MEKGLIVISYKGDDSATRRTSGPFKTPEAAERALISLFQSGQASDGRIVPDDVLERIQDVHEVLKATNALPALLPMRVKELLAAIEGR